MKDEDVVSEEEFRVLLIEVTEWTVLKWKGVAVGDSYGVDKHEEHCAQSFSKFHYKSA